MKKIWKYKVFTTIIFMALAFGSLQFVTWISQMAFENTCIELQEQYIGTEVGEVINTIENSVNFGKELENYYGMENVLSQVCNISKGNIKAAVLNTKGEALYLSFEKSAENIDLLSKIYAQDYQNELLKVKGTNSIGKNISLGSEESLVFPIYKNGKEQIGHFIVIYQQKSLLVQEEFTMLEKIKWGAWGVVSVLLLLFFVTRRDDEKEKWYIRFMPVILIMLSMLVYIISMYQTYQTKYTELVERNARSASVYIRGAVDDIIEKGLPVENIEEVSGYLNQKVENNVAIESIAIVQNYYDTSETIKNDDSAILRLNLANHNAQLNVVVSQSYIGEKVRVMTLTFGAVFVICLMITYELTHLAEIISVRTSKEFNQETPEQKAAIGGQIRLLSFLTYTAIYTSMSYTAVIMRNWDATLFGLTKEISASLPLTVELLCVLISSVVVQKVFEKMKLSHLAILTFLFLILGNAACMTVSSPYVLLGLRAFCGIGFGMLKYWLNSMVAAGSDSTEAIGKNYAKLNAGLLGGITVGASLGSILAQSLGYQFNYYFTAILGGVVLVIALAVMPWKMLQARRKQSVEKSKTQSVRLSLILKDSAVRKTLLLGDIPLNIGLMYVVAFLPVYMNNMGQPTVVTSYAYLINGLAGVYIGVAMMSILKRLSIKLSSVLAMILGAAGILVLVLDSSVGVILLSAGIMGLFDGYGTPTITSFFTGLPSVQKADTASMLTVFNGVGSVVQILCPMLYNLLIQPDGSTTYLFAFGICYVVIAILFMMLFRKKDTEGFHVSRQ